ncbi:MAG TPA: FAD-binding oxidoreductase [Spirochaetota bacterium]|nr:FAD-binding oxidoreductase [Spirochaetota bacterium]
MKEELVKQLDRYDDVIKEMEIARRYGSDHSLERGEVAKYINTLHPASMTLRVNDIIDETPSTKTLRLTATEGRLPPFIAGQYISLFVEAGKVRTSRAYSISSPPNQTAYYDITVRRVENGLVSGFLLDRVKIGDRLESSGPAGTFYYNPIIHDNTVVYLAGGSGITPFMSMIREIAQRGTDRIVYLFYGNRGDDDIIFHEELAAIGKKVKKFHYIPVIEKPAAGYAGKCGFITADLMKEVLKKTGDKTYFICGPQGLYDFCLPEMVSMGIPRRKIRREVFGAPVNIYECPGWPESVKKDAVFNLKVKGVKTAAIRASSRESILSALEKNGIVLPSLCRSGECSMCRLKLVAGKVFQPKGTPVRKSDRQFGYIHSCVSYPLEDCEILI